jgi:hypothetical protein
MEEMTEGDPKTGDGEGERGLGLSGLGEMGAW